MYRRPLRSLLLRFHFGSVPICFTGRSSPSSPRTLMRGVDPSLHRQDIHYGQLLQRLPVCDSWSCGHEKRFLVTTIASLAAAGTLVSYARFRRELTAACARLKAGGTMAQTAWGLVEYGEQGHGEPVLAIHGAGGGYDQGLLIARDMGEGYRVIAPSRFGYLQTPVPRDFSPAAQADAHAALLDFLQVERCVVLAASGGAPSAIELTLRHPNRVSALILPGPAHLPSDPGNRADQSVPSQSVLRLIEASADFCSGWQCA